MSKKTPVRNFFHEMLVEYGKIVEMNGRTWHV
jgi:hypothetical protein